MKWLCRKSLTTNSNLGLMPSPPQKWRGLQACLKVASGAALGTLSSVAWGLGLGDLQHRSYLGEPFKATLELVSVDAGMDPANLRVRRLSGVEAERIGVDVFYTANRFDFSVVRNEQGGLSIQVISAEPVNEPFLNLVVELRWPTGTVYRDYPILLDLPPSGFEREPRAAESRGTQEAPSRTSRESSTAPVMSLPPLTTEAGQYQVSSGDTLSAIAARWREGSELSLADTSRWLFENNPHAFIGNDRNRLRAGAVLQMPDLSAVDLTSESPQAPVQRPASATPAAAPRTGQVPAQAAPAAREPAALPTDTALTGGTRGMLTVGAESRDDRTRELIDMLVRENESLQARVERLENSEYLNTMQSLLVLQRQQIRELRAELGIADNEMSEEVDRLFAEIGLSDAVVGEPRTAAPTEGEAPPAPRAQTPPQSAGEPAPADDSAGTEIAPGIISLDRPAMGGAESSQRGWLFAALLGAGVLLTLAFVAMFAYYRKMVPAPSKSEADDSRLPAVPKHAHTFKAEKKSEDEDIAYPEGMDTTVKIYEPERPPNWLGEKVTLDEFDASREALFADEPYSEFDNLSLDEDALDAVMAAPESTPARESAVDDKSLEALTEELPEDRKEVQKKIDRRPDEEVRMSIAEKMAQYDPEGYRAELESLDVMELHEMDEIAGNEEDEIDTLVYRAMMFCEFKKFTKARQLLEGRMVDSDDPRLHEALDQLEAMQAGSEKAS